MTVVVAEVELPTERLEAEVCTLAGQIAAATCRLVLLIGELDRRESWRGWGCRSMAHWLSWRCAMSIVTAREHIRIGRALEELPLTTAEFAAGRLSYSKVRALTRVATPEIERKMLDFALDATAAQLARTVRAYERARGDGSSERNRLERRRLRMFTEDDGMVMVEARLTREQADLLRQALDKAVVEVPREPEDAPAEARRADALELLARSFLAGNAERAVTETVVHVDADELAEEQVSPYVERLMCDTSIRVDVRKGSMHEIGRRRPNIPVALRRAIARRDRHGCRFPGCPHERFLHVHHIAHVIANGPTNTENCIQLCSFHHRLVHDGGWKCWGDGDTTILFVSPTGKRFTDAPAGASPEPLDLPHVAGINERTITTSLGERLNLDYAVGAMLAWRRDPPI